MDYNMERNRGEKNNRSHETKSSNSKKENYLRNRRKYICDEVVERITKNSFFERDLRECWVYELGKDRNWKCMHWYEKRFGEKFLKGNNENNVQQNKICTKLMYKLENNVQTYPFQHKRMAQIGKDKDDRNRIKS